VLEVQFHIGEAVLINAIYEGLWSVGEFGKRLPVIKYIIVLH
jgi:hypothetical protein